MVPQSERCDVRRTGQATAAFKGGGDQAKDHAASGRRREHRFSPTTSRKEQSLADTLTLAQ